MTKHTIKKPDYVQFGCKLPKALVKKIHKEAAEREVKIKDLIEVAIEEYFKK